MANSRLGRLAPPAWLWMAAALAALAWGALPRLAELREAARERSTRLHLAGLQAAVARYYVEQEGRYPPALDSRSRRRGGRELPAFLPGYLARIPRVEVLASNPANGSFAGRGPGLGPLAEAVSEGSWDRPPFPADDSGKGWRYDPLSGEIRINSALLDLSGRPYCAWK